MADDIFIISFSGLPYYSKCFGGSTCMKHPDHNLQTGFLAAIYNFAKETFNQAEIKRVIFSDLKINVKVDPEHQLLIAFTNPLDVDDGKIEEKLEQTLQQLIERFKHSLNTGFIMPDLYNEFEHVIKELNIVEKSPMQDIPLRKIKRPWWKRLLGIEK